MIKIIRHKTVFLLIVLYDVLDVLHSGDGDLQHVAVLEGALGLLSVALTEAAAAGPELGAGYLLTGQRLDVVLSHPETRTAESKVWREHLHLPVLQLGDDTSEPILSRLEDHELPHAEIIRGHRNLLGILSQILEVDLHRNDKLLNI